MAMPKQSTGSVNPYQNPKDLFLWKWQYQTHGLARGSEEITQPGNVTTKLGDSQFLIS